MAAFLGMSFSLLRRLVLTMACALAAAWCPCAVHAETVYFNGTDFKAGYYIVPDNMPADGSKVWVVVDVHGASGLRNQGRGPGLAKLLAPEPVIVIVPSFSNGYQGGDGQWAEQLIDNFKEVGKKHPVHDKMFVHGHSGGGQFAHRFAFAEPKYVVGVSAHSSGSWACDGGHGSISSRARGIPFSISCGEKDTAYSVKGAKHTRIEWYGVFAAELERKGFVMAGNTWPGVGHGVSARLYGPQLVECFHLATKGIVPASDKWKGDVQDLARTNRKKYGGPPATATVSTSETSALRAANAAVASGRAPDTGATLRFLVKHPASSWAGKDEFAELKAHCR
ncbi:MAG: hypothetical protein HKO57_15330, partial [Akkermansiaceae bacterium]|nr:hypothetical protein [Akkermansiaceae bacterium]